ncbi:hypothetical protein JQ615_32620 [Bradyrhizobium jicamae]|uniref:Uncharacterized protein n=1 Tax=Bradyrhizobium jicamae TaxID=280332 RepID=A0ABS5FTQ8_9BRAD|nr:hypothetical protein [Bradyrhizobium jicamae]MBR0800123.1 hypothetical protein [Bradyrhizobium jicamae]
MRTPFRNELPGPRLAATVFIAANPAPPFYPDGLLLIPALRMSAPVAADGLVVVVRRGLGSVMALAALRPPVAPDRDVVRTAAILPARLFRLLMRLNLLDGAGLRQCRTSTERESQCESG